MCIRDRRNTIGCHGTDTIVSCNCSSRYIGSANTTDFIKRCLLYTSDAADERSSVDLGGRRIIKKKNIIDVMSKIDFTKRIKT